MPLVVTALERVRSAASGLRSIVRRSQPRILWVEDEPGLIDAEVSGLKARGLDVIVVTPTDDISLEILDSVDLVILDIRWSKCDSADLEFASGQEYGKWLTLARANLPVFLMSGYYDQEDVAVAHFYMNPLATVRRYSKLDIDVNKLYADILDVIEFESEHSDSVDKSLPHGRPDGELALTWDEYCALDVKEKLAWTDRAEASLRAQSDRVFDGSSADWILFDPANAQLIRWGHHDSLPSNNDVIETAKRLGRMPLVVEDLQPDLVDLGPFE